MMGSCGAWSKMESEDIILPHHWEKVLSRFLKANDSKKSMMYHKLDEEFKFMSIVLARMDDNLKYGRE